jgi:hypothetical protein
MATGNRTTDKAGANRVLSQLANRVMHLEMEPHLDDWVRWAIGSNIDTTLISFLQFRPNLLCDFNPDQFSNPTPRAWEKVNDVPTTLKDGIFHAMVSGLVGAGASAEYVGFRKIANEVVSADQILLDPKGAPVPDEPAARYAVTGSLAAKASKDNFDLICLYLERMPAEFQVLCMRTSVAMCSGVVSTRAFTQWANANANVMM